MRVEGVFRCVDCGWVWPLLLEPDETTECDACGGEMERTEADL